MPGKAPVSLRYLGAHSIVVRGPVTGQGYTFTPLHPVCAVDHRDCEALLRTRLFQRDS